MNKQILRVHLNFLFDMLHFHAGGSLEFCLYNETFEVCVYVREIKLGKSTAQNCRKLKKFNIFFRVKKTLIPRESCR